MSRRSLAGSWVFFLRLAENDAEHARPLAEFLQRMAIMNFQLVAILGQQRRPILALGNGRRLVKGRTRLLIRHFEEQQKRQLLHIIAVGQTIVEENVALVPKLLDEGVGIAHERQRIKTSTPRDASSREG